ncbi:TIGR02147 family protein [Bdellovibrio sp. HCB290]|uniref:TIGR02147 family protein n=1 Tax=Bdellovibrio sp. HCB290 TaxID=3394356 RepID=UPI0039B6994A
MNIFEFTDYREYLERFVKSQPKGGHGYKLKIAEALGVHPTLVTQVLKGQKSFTQEQAFALAQFIRLNDLEKDFLLTMLEWDKAGTIALKNFVESKLLKLRQESEKIKNRVPVYTAMTEADQALFYSQWYYSALRLSSGLGKKKVTAATLSKDLDLPGELVEKVLEFLISRQLVIEKEDGSLDRGPQNTFLPADSPMISRHHMNWRMKAMERHPRITKDEMAFSAPLTLAESDIPEVRKMCLELIQKVSKKVAESPSDRLACINIDWFLVE